jgi:hypothetical protein
MPAGATRTYIRMVQGRNKKPSSGQMKEPGKAKAQRVGAISHHTKIAARGPKNMRTVNKQHIVSLLLTNSGTNVYLNK